MIDLFISAFVTLFVVIDPPGCAPIYASLTTGASALQRRSMAIRATLIAGFILIFFAMFGEALLSFLHIDLDSFRIAGGVMLFIIAIDMVFEKRTERREQRAEKLMATPEVEDVSVFPMAMPMLAGPGSIASVMLLVSQNSGLDRALVIFGALLLVLLLTLAALLLAGPFMRLMTEGKLPEPRLTGKGKGRRLPATPFPSSTGMDFIVRRPRPPASPARCGFRRGGCTDSRPACVRARI